MRVVSYASNMCIARVTCTDSAIMGMSNSGHIFLLITTNIVTSLRLGISYYPGVNLWVGERLIMECRVAGGEHREQETVVWYRQQDLVMGEIISHGDTMLMEDQRFKLEKQYLRTFLFIRLR